MVRTSLVLWIVGVVNIAANLWSPLIPLILICCLCVPAGKKGSDLGEYDPLTQADSDDESEEDDLVLNYPRNGLGRDGCLGSGPSKLRAGRSGRLVGATGESQDEEEEEDEWTEQLSSKSRRGSQRESGTGEDRGGAGTSGSSGLGAIGSEAEEKRKRARNATRSAFFLVPLACVTLILLLCAFLIPCQKAELERKLQWEITLGNAGGEKKIQSVVCEIQVYKHLLAGVQSEDTPKVVLKT